MTGGASHSPADEAAREAASSVRLHGVADLGFAALYALVGFKLAPSRHAWFGAVLGGVVVLLAVAGLALALRVRHARRLAQLAQGALLAFTAAVLVLLVASAAYLRGIYGPLGQGLAAITLVVAALVLQLCGLLPLLQLRMLGRPAVRRLLDGGRAAVRAAPAATGAVDGG